MKNRLSNKQISKAKNTAYKSFAMGVRESGLEREWVAVDEHLGFKLTTEQWRSFNTSALVGILLSIPVFREQMDAQAKALVAMAWEDLRMENAKSAKSPR